MPKPACIEPVIYVHAKDRHQPDADAMRGLLELGLPVCCRLAYPSLTKTTHGYDQPGKLVTELAQLFPGKPIIFLRAGLLPSKDQIDELTRLLQLEDQPAAMTLLSNADSNTNPFAGLSIPEPKTGDDLAGLVGLLAPGQLHELTSWTDHFVILSAPLVDQLVKQGEDSSLLQTVGHVGGALKVADHLFLHDPEKSVVAPLDLQLYETAKPPPFAGLSARIQAWFDAGIDQLPLNPSANQPATLHITHSWGGGVAQWLRSYIETDQGQQHFQLRSEGPQSGRGFGQRLGLYAGNELRCPIASWWLNPAIQSVSENHDQYQAVLRHVCGRYGIGRIFVSSLVGHSLDVLRSGLPTVQILHDHFPAWPLLSVNPEPYMADGGSLNLELALKEHRKDLEFNDKDAQAWTRLGENYFKALKDFDVGVAAPGQSVMDIQTRLIPSFTELETEVIPHGFPDMENQHAIQPRPRADGRLRLVILGRMQTGKGQALLARALPELAKYVQVYLLGTGKSGEAFFGMPGVDVILEYERDELASILTTIGPHFAALLSVVPETYSYTLSELQQMQIPVIATRAGSFPGRIEDDKTGWLIDINPDALVRQVAELCESHGKIAAVRSNLAKITPPTLENMLQAYDRLCPPPLEKTAFRPVSVNLDQAQSAAVDFQNTRITTQLGEANARKTELAEEVKKRTRWALDEHRQLEDEQRRRAEWVANLETEIERLAQMVAERQAGIKFTQGQLELLEDDYRQLKKKHQQLTTNLQQLESNHQQLQGNYQFVSTQNTMIINSLSWRVTRPLRVGRRVFRNFKQARAWNPARWPLLVSQLARNLATTGISGTLQRLQTNAVAVAPAPQPVIVSKETKVAVQAPSAFPETEQVKASIVIPVYNKWAYTAACLCSLLETKGRFSFEVIVVDDQSSDETQEQLANIKGITYLRNEENLGFVGSCNRGARQARGEYLVLLNNDTQVTDSWLDELIDTFDREPKAGMVGSRLIYPDGTQQESGGIIFNDGSGWNYGRGQNAENPEYHFLREVDYCSGAAIALKTAYFREIGALDERYAPAYYEDTDLAFRVRESGLKVFVQPASVVIHHEGVTSGTDTSSGTKKYQLINQAKFVERWKTELQSQPSPVHDPNNRSEIFVASQHRLKKRILIIDATTPEPDKDSGSVRLTNMMQCCRELGFGVTFFADNSAYAGKYTRDLQKSGIEVLYHPWLSSPADFFRQRGREFDYIMISRHYVAINYVSLIKRYAPQAKFIFDTVDLHYLREQRLAELEQSKTLKKVAQQTRRSELIVIKTADAALVVSTVEKQVLAKDAPGEKVHILSNIHQVPGRDNDFSDRKDIYFVGGYQHPPNVDAACWFVNDIWPLIHEKLPELRFHLIGSKAPDQVRNLQGNGVVFHGFVESIDPFLSDCRIAVAPLRYGAGVKGKVNMSMAHGQPVVATPAAVEGMFAKHEKDILVAADAESFAREVVRLYQDEALWNRISDASVQNVEEHFSVATARQHLLSLFDSFETE